MMTTIHKTALSSVLVLIRPRLITGHNTPVTCYPAAFYTSIFYQHSHHHHSISYTPHTHRVKCQGNYNTPTHTISLPQHTSLLLWPVNQHTSIPPTHQLPSKTHYHTLLHRPSVLIGDDPAVTFNIRHKSKKKQRDSGSDSDSDVDDNLDDDDFDAPTNFKVMTIHAPSLRVDAVISKALGLGRHRLEEIFFGSGILVNGEKLLKKGGKMEVGDYVDVVMERLGEKVKVKRVKLLKVDQERTSTDKLTVRVRVWKSPFLIDNPRGWKPQE